MGQVAMLRFFVEKTTKKIEKSTKYHAININIDGDKLISASNTAEGTSSSAIDANVEFLSEDKKVVHTVKLLQLDKSSAAQFQLVDPNSLVTFKFKDKSSTTLPTQMNTHLLGFLQRHNPGAKTKYSCMHFLYEILNGREMTKGTQDENCVDCKYIKEDDLVAGDPVVLYNDKNQYHFAIFIANGHYLSMYGASNEQSGPVLIATLNEMHKHFNTKYFGKVNTLALGLADRNGILKKWEQDYMIGAQNNSENKR